LTLLFHWKIGPDFLLLKIPTSGEIDSKLFAQFPRIFYGLFSLPNIAMPPQAPNQFFQIIVKQLIKFKAGKNFVISQD
jgi:hypothetical protein